jgi:hypothetical protein
MRPMSMNKLFIEHPASVGETYTEHLVHASGFGAKMVWGGLACIVHAILPFMFVKTASIVIHQLHDRMVINRAKIPVSNTTSTATR